MTVVYVVSVSVVVVLALAVVAPWDGMVDELPMADVVMALIALCGSEDEAQPEVLLDVAGREDEEEFSAGPQAEP